MNSNIGNKERNKLQRVLMSLLLSILMIMCAMMLCTTASSAEAGNDGQKEIVIESVEDIPAGEIEEQEVPLAAMPDTSERVGMRHAVMMILLLAGTAAYATYFINYEKKLVVLRARAAEAEEKAMKQRREKASGGR